MNDKIWFRMVVGATLVILILFAAITVVIDPFFHYHKPLSSLQYPILLERYQNDGILKHFDYDAVLTGTSMSQNFKTSEFDSLFGTKSVKVPFAAARYRETSENMERAILENEKLKLIVRGMDYYFLVWDKDDMAYDTYPEYLYDDKLFNDVYYVLNKEVLLQQTLPVLTYTKNGNKTTTFDEYANWNSQYTFGRDSVFAGFIRSPLSDKVMELTEEERITVQENISQNMTAIAKRHPEVTFYIYIPPYSVLYWENIVRQGRLGWHIEAERIALEELLKYENIKVFSFSDQFEVTTNLDFYKDEIHYSEEISSQMLVWMKEGTGLVTKENMEEYLTRIESFYGGYDYEVWYQ